MRKSELKNNSVQEFVKLLKDINDNQEKLNLKNVEVLAYASPDGGVKFNDKLASKRQDVSVNYAEKQLKEAELAGDVTGKYTAQDWDGFQKLVAASNIQDKDVILRVLSMYQDPEEREQQIRNMSAGFRELADGILPELRRSRLIINYETIGRSDEQIKEQYKADAAQLSVDELLYAATLEDNLDARRQSTRRPLKFILTTTAHTTTLQPSSLQRATTQRLRTICQRLRASTATQLKLTQTSVFWL